MVDIYGDTQGRDMGSISRQITQTLNTDAKSLPRGTFVTLKGQVTTMRSSYIGLLGGLVFSIVLVYLLIVVNFQSWIDPSTSSPHFQQRWPASCCFCFSPARD